MRSAIVAFCLAACSVPPPAETVVDQSLCQRDPTTGRCKSTRDPGDAQSLSENWVIEHYPNAQSISIGCARGNDGWGCSILIDDGEWQYDIGCGELDCGVVDGPA